MRLAHAHAGPNVLARASIIHVHADVYDTFFFSTPFFRIWVFFIVRILVCPDAFSIVAYYRVAAVDT